MELIWNGQEKEGVIRGFFSSNFRDDRKTTEEGEIRNKAFRFPFSEFRLLGHQEQRKRRDKGHLTQAASCSQCSQPKPVESPQVALLLWPCSLSQAGSIQHQPQKPTVESRCLRNVAQGFAVGSRREVQHPTVGSA